MASILDLLIVLYESRVSYPRRNGREGVVVYK